MRKLARALLGCCLGLSLLVPLFTVAAPAQAQGPQPLILVLEAEGPVAPTMVQYIRRGISTAENRRADLLILQLNTPGGLVSSMSAIVEDILDSPVPVVVYIAPRGGMAASAGTIITLAAHAAAMAPDTIIGAASPVDASGQDLTETMQAKEKNAMRALVRSLASRRTPEAVALAEATIEEASAVSAEEALEVGLVDFIATDVDDLLAQLDGFPVVFEGQEWALETTNPTIELISLTFLEQVLNILTNPNIVFLLINLGVWAILIELSSPGGWVAGTVGVVALALATYGLGILPVNLFGLIFILVAFALFVLEIKAPTHGALSLTGIVMLIIGALVLFDMPELPGLPRISPTFVAGVSVATALSFGVIVSFALRAQKAPIRTGQEGVVGRVGVVRQSIDPRGTVYVAGELWTAEQIDDTGPLLPGARVEVVKVEGITLQVKSVE